MYFAASLFLAFAITLLFVSKIAKMLNAKRPDIAWVLIALIISVVLAVGTMTALAMFIQGLAPNVMLVITLLSVFIISSAAYKYLNQLNWSGAFTLNVASMSIGLLTAVAAIVVNGESIEKSFEHINITSQNSAVTVENVASEDQVEEYIITERDFLPAKAVRDLKKKEKRVYIEPKFRVISIGNIHSAVGHRIRIHRKNGNTIIGGLKRVDGNDAVISQYGNRGTVVMPISISKIKKLEVYR